MKMTDRTFDQWRATADGFFIWRTTDDPVARGTFLDKIAAKCCELAHAGQPASVMHAHALIGGFKCRCYACETVPVARAARIRAGLPVEG